VICRFEIVDSSRLMTAPRVPRADATYADRARDHVEVRLGVGDRADVVRQAEGGGVDRRHPAEERDPVVGRYVLEPDLEGDAGSALGTVEQLDAV
jgi:hypothetical protein